jgi:ketosteroid isomerase-like protein
VLVNVLLLFGVLTSAAQSTNRSGVKEFEEAEFKALIDRYYAAWSTLRTENPAPFYAKDANLVFFDFAPLQYKGWNEYQEGVKKNFFDKMSGGKVTPNNDLRVTRRGNIAWTTLTEHFSTTLKDGRTIEIEGRHTAIWEKRNSKWLIVHEHVSAPLPPL